MTADFLCPRCEVALTAQEGLSTRRYSRYKAAMLKFPPFRG
jgi:hypothetical protein